LSTGRRRSTTAGRGPVALYGARGATKSRSKVRGTDVASASGLDLAGRLKLFQRALRNHVEQRDALIDVVASVNTTLEPAKIAELLVERATSWVPAPCWAVVSSDLSGQLSVLAERGLDSIQRDEICQFHCLQSLLSDCVADLRLPQTDLV